MREILKGVRKMLEIIKRTDGEKSEKVAVRGIRAPQICYNSWGHLSIRIIVDTEPMKDVLVVLDRDTSCQVMEFCECIKPPASSGHYDPADDELPF